MDNKNDPVKDDRHPARDAVYFIPIGNLDKNPALIRAGGMILNLCNGLFELGKMADLKATLRDMMDNTFILMAGKQSPDDAVKAYNLFNDLTELLEILEAVELENLKTAGS